MPSRRLSAARRARRATNARQRPAAAAAPAPDGRDRILAVAISSFSEVGYEGTTTAGIARAAAVTQPLVHHHFGSKDGLWRAAMDVVFGALPSVGTPAQGSPSAALVALVGNFIRFVAAHPEATRIVAREGAKPSARLDYLVSRYLGEPFHQILDLVRAGQREGVVAPHIRADLLLFLILGAGSHVFDVTAFAKRSVGLDVGDPRTRDDFVALVGELLRQGLLHDGPAPRRRRKR